MKYDFDSYLLYEMTPAVAYTVKVKVQLKETVDGETLRRAAEMAFRRFWYFAKMIRMNSEDAFVFENTGLPIIVKEETDQPVVLGSPETNGLYFCVTYREKDVYFNFAHNFCGGCGAMPWIQATLWQYFSDRYHKQINSDGIKTPYTPVFPNELAYPDAEKLPDDEPLGGYKGGDSYIPMDEYMTYFQDPSIGTKFYPIEIGNRDLIKYAKENDGSPNSIICAMMFRALSRVYRDRPETAQISGKIICNYRKDVGCPETYRDLVRMLHVKYTSEMSDWSIEKLSTTARGSMYLQMQPEFSVQEYQRLMEFRKGIDEQKSFQEKADYALKNSLMRSDINDTYTVSYVGNLFWGGLAEYIEAVYSITDGHLMLEVNSLPEKFCISFEVFNNSDRKYLDAFLQVMDEEGIPYTVGEAEKTNLPGIQLPVPHS
ncbi:MAG: hypothetical protein IJI41_12805 [Anaerolineaceae bacterium]|nr:hypothetical protein [Anaerolineaceae bacterium]